MVAQEQFSFRLSVDVKKLFDSLYDNLGPPKFKIIEASIEVFAALPKPAQRILKSQDESDRKAILDLIRKLKS